MRIVSLISSATEMLFALGLGDRVVGVSHECDYPAEVAVRPRVTRANIDSNAPSKAIDDEVRAKLSSGEPLYAIDEPQLLALRPDLIITQAQCDVCAVRYQDVVNLVSRNDALQCAKILALNPVRLEDILADIRKVGEATQSQAAAEQYVASLAARVDAVRLQSAGIPTAERRRVALIEWIEPLMLAGNWMPELVEYAGGRHDLTRSGEHSPYVSWEQLLAYDPQSLAVAPCGFSLERTLQECPALLAREGWSDLAAVHAGRAFAVDGNAYFNRSGPRIVDSLEILAHVVYPERIPLPEFAQSGVLQRL